MLNFQIHKQLIELDFNSIKIIQTNFTTKLISDIINSKTLEINNIKIKDSNIIYLNDLSKLSSLVNFSKNSSLTMSITSQLSENNSLVNVTLQEEIIKNINALYKFPLVQSIDGDLTKIINNSFEINDSHLNFSIFYSLLGNFYDHNYVFIFDNVSWLNKSNINLLNNFLNSHNFIIFTNNMLSFLNTTNDLEYFAFINQDNNYFDVIDKEKMIAYLEKELSLPINNDFLNQLSSNEESFETIKFMSLIKKIIKN